MQMAESLLTYAVQGGRIDMVIALLGGGADTEKANSEGVRSSAFVQCVSVLYLITPCSKCVNAISIMLGTDNGAHACG
jgi:hypothetical protein